MHTETDGQNEGIAATPPHTEPASKKPASAGNPSKQKSTTKETAQAALELEEEQRQAAAAQAIKQPPLGLKHYTNFLLEMGRVVTGQSSVEPDAKDKRFTDEVWKTNPYYRALLQTYLTWQQSLGAFIDDADLDTKDADRA